MLIETKVVHISVTQITHAWQEQLASLWTTSPLIAACLINSDAAGSQPVNMTGVSSLRRHRWADRRCRRSIKQVLYCIVLHAV